MYDRFASKAVFDKELGFRDLNPEVTNKNGLLYHTKLSFVGCILTPIVYYPTVFKFTHARPKYPNVTNTQVSEFNIIEQCLDLWPSAAVCTYRILRMRRSTLSALRFLIARICGFIELPKLSSKVEFMQWLLSQDYSQQKEFIVYGKS